MRSYRDLHAWQVADELAVVVYEVTAGFPSSERFGLTSQLRRAAVSVPANLAEGTGRTGSNELGRFVSISLGSLTELRYLADLSQRLGYLDPESLDRIEGLAVRAGRLLGGLRRRLTPS